MWLFSRLLVLLVLVGCGFAPAFGPGGPAQGLMEHVRAADPVDQYGFDFVKQVEARLGRASTVDYDLAYTISTGSDGVGITSEGAITRYNVSGTAVWTLTRAGQRVAGGTVDSFTGYSATGSTVAGLAARRDAYRRLMVILADEVVAHMVAGVAQ